MRQIRNSTTSFWYFAALGMYLLAAANAILLAYAWSHFALTNPGYFEDAWPTFSRALTLGAAEMYEFLAGVAGAGLFFGAFAIAVMRWQQARAVSQSRGLFKVWALLAALAAPLGIVHYYHVVIRLNEHNDTHMLLSYTFFFGMSFVIIADLWCRLRVASLNGTTRRAQGAQFGLHNQVGWAVAADSSLFLLTFIFKDTAWNPWPGPTQKLFVLTECLWIILAHAYAVLYVPQVRSHFSRNHKLPAGLANAGVPNVIVAALAALVFGGYLPGADAQVPGQPARIGGTGRIEPVNGIIALVAPAGRMVAQVTARQGERVRKGTVLVVMADQSARALERDSAAERLRDAQQQYAIRDKVSELDVEAARLAVSQARDELDVIEALDQRTIAAKEKRQRENALALAQTKLKLAETQRMQARQSFDAEQNSLRSRLKLASAELATMQLVAPVDATVLEVNVRAGASAGAGPSITLADTSRMYVVTDFFEGDLARLASGQRATVTNAALGQPLQGRLERIGRQVDPVNRLVKAWVALDQSSPADRFIGMQVDVKVDPEHTAQGKGGRP